MRETFYYLFMLYSDALFVYFVWIGWRMLACGTLPAFIAC